MERAGSATARTGAQAVGTASHAATAPLLGPEGQPRAGARASGAAGGRVSAAGIRAKASERWRAARGPACCAMRGSEVERGEVELHQVDPLRLAGGEVALQVEGDHGLRVQQRHDHRHVHRVAQQPHTVLGCELLGHTCSRCLGRTRRAHAALRHGCAHRGRDRSGDPVHCSRARAGRRCRRLLGLRRRRRVRGLRGELVEQLGGVAREELATIWAGEGAAAREGRCAARAGHRGRLRRRGHCDRRRHARSSGSHGRGGR